jgi:hypothetical protein
MEEDMILDPSIGEGCINRNFCSSFLFLLPAFYGYLIYYTSIIIGSIICLFTSTLHHYYKANNKQLCLIDKICVNSIAIYFIIDGLTLQIGFIYIKN